MTKAETQARVLEEWFRLPESRRRYATDAVAFAYRLLRDQPELLGGPKEIGHESIVDWLLPNSRLLTVHGWGHTSLFLSQCADAAVARYLLETVTPAPGTVCEQDVVPFSG